jgi:uncharacterized membrane-anchored protein YhcB (DUF1043 family)
MEIVDVSSRAARIAQARLQNLQNLKLDLEETKIALKNAQNAAAMGDGVAGARALIDELVEKEADLQRKIAEASQSYAARDTQRKPALIEAARERVAKAQRELASAIAALQALEGVQ